MYLKHFYLIICFLICLSIRGEAQQTMGLFNNSSGSFDGYTLFAPTNSYETYLIDNCGEKVHSWTSSYLPGLSCYLMDNGVLLRTGKVIGGGGLVEMIDWAGTVIWSHSVGATHGRQHHDIELLQNGNILLLVRDEKTQAEVIQAGGSTSVATVKSEKILEIHPDASIGGATVVWEWSAWDHLIQDVNSLKDNFGVVGQSPGKININFLPHTSSDWLHFNAITYNAEFDQIIVSSRNFSEFWIIDHSTSTAEAASSSGGTYGKGGDLLYRWGNPQAYKQGTAADQKLFKQHHPIWIADSLLDAGKIMLFNNDAGVPFGLDYSTVNVIDLPVDSLGFYAYGGGAYGPTGFHWTYQATNPLDFYSSKISGAQRLDNTNTLICSGEKGRFFEVDTVGNIVWEYVNPVNNLGPMVQQTPVNNNTVFRCERFPVNHSTLLGKVLTPQGYIETGSTFSCTLYSDIDLLEGKELESSVYPNPASDYFVVEIEGDLDEAASCSLFDMSGKCHLTLEIPRGSSRFEVDTRNLVAGVYIVQVKSESQLFQTKQVILNR